MSKPITIYYDVVLLPYWTAGKEQLMQTLVQLSYQASSGGSMQSALGPSRLQINSVNAPLSAATQEVALLMQ